VTSYFSNQRQLAHGQFEKEIDHTELSPHRRGTIIARLFGIVDPTACLQRSAAPMLPSEFPSFEVEPTD
jgi:hypothetical protein